MSRIHAANLASVRKSLGMDLCRAASALRVSPQYLAGVERTGADSFVLAQRIARLYGIPVDALLPKRRPKAAPKKTCGTERARRLSAATRGKGEQHMAYGMKVGEQHPCLIGMALDGSGSMGLPWPGSASGTKTIKAETLATIVSKSIRDIGANCVFPGGIKDRCDVAIIGYEGNGARPLWSGNLAGRDTVPISEVIANPLGTVSQKEQRSDPVEGVVEVEREYSYWMTPLVGGGTPMGQGLKLAREAAERWLKEPGHADSFPPVILHITDGMPDGGERQMALDEAESIKALATTDGNALLVTVHIADGYGQTILFPADESELPTGDDSAKLLYQMASTLPSELLESAAGAGLPVKQGSKMMIMNADAMAAARLINWGSSAGVARAAK